ADGAAEAHGGGGLVDEFHGLRPDGGGAEDFAGFGVGDHFDEAFGFSHNHGLAVIGERIGSGPPGAAGSGGGGFVHADGGGLGLGENAEELEAVIHALQFIRTAQKSGGIARGDFSLLHGDVDDLGFSADISGGKNVRDGGLHGGGDGDLAGGE